MNKKFFAGMITVLLFSISGFAQTSTEEEEVAERKQFIYFESGESGLALGGLFENQSYNGGGGDVYGAEALLVGSYFWNGDSRNSQSETDPRGNRVTVYRRTPILSRVGGRGNFNVVTNSNEENGDLGTTLGINFRVGMAYDLGELDPGFDLFVGAGASGGYSQYFNQSIYSASQFSIGPESGVRFMDENVTVLVTPSVGFGGVEIESNQIKERSDGYRGAREGINAGNWAFGGRTVVHLKAVEFYGDYFRIARDNSEEFQSWGTGSNGELRIRIDERLSLLAYYEAISAFQERGYEVLDDRGEPYPVEILEEAHRWRFGIGGQVKFGGHRR